MAETVPKHFGKTMALATHDDDVPVTKKLGSVLGWRTTLVEKQKCVGDEGRPHERLEMEAQVEISNRGVMWCTSMAT